LVTAAISKLQPPEIGISRYLARLLAMRVLINQAG
jgi:hypothetical protein